MYSHYPECKHISQITNFFDMCSAIQQSSRYVFDEAARELDVENIFVSEYKQIPVLLKVIKYLSSYNASRPHYDGTAFSLFLDSTDNQSLLLSSYKSTLTVDDFFSPVRKFPRSDNHNSMLLIPGTLLTEFALYPIPHIVEHNGKIRYATIAFAMRPHYTFQKNSFSLLPHFKS